MLFLTLLEERIWAPKSSRELTRWQLERETCVRAHKNACEQISYLLLHISFSHTGLECAGGVLRKRMMLLVVVVLLWW